MFPQTEGEKIKEGVFRERKLNFQLHFFLMVRPYGAL